MNWKTLLVPHDFSTCADAALRLATDLAQFHASRVILLHVISLPPGFSGDSLISDPETKELVRIDEYARAGSLGKLEALAEQPRAAGLDVEVRAAIGDVAAHILGVAADVHADLIVMGTHGKTGLTRLVLGSMTERVLRQASMPVLTLRDRSE